MKTFKQLRNTITEKFVDIDSLRHAKVEEKPVKIIRVITKTSMYLSLLKTQVARLEKN